MVQSRCRRAEARPGRERRRNSQLLPSWSQLRAVVDGSGSSCDAGGEPGAFPGARLCGEDEGSSGAAQEDPETRPRVPLARAGAEVADPGPPAAPSTLQQDLLPSSRTFWNQVPGCPADCRPHSRGGHSPSPSSLSPNPACPRPTGPELPPIPFGARTSPVDVPQRRLLQTRFARCRWTLTTPHRGLEGPKTAETAVLRGRPRPLPRAAPTASRRRHAGRVCREQEEASRGLLGGVIPRDGAEGGGCPAIRFLWVGSWLRRLIQRRHRCLTRPERATWPPPRRPASGAGGSE